VEPVPSKQVEVPVPSGNKNATLFIGAITGFQNSFLISSLNVSLPAISHEFKPDAVLLSWVVTSFILSIAVFSVPFGRISDIVGIKRIYTLGIIFLIAGMVITVFSTSTLMLIICLVIQGISNAMMAGTAIAMQIAVFPPKERGRAIGITVACVYIGLSLGPFLGGILTEQLGWRSIFIIDALVCSLVLSVLLWKIKGEWAESRGEQFDYTGSAIFGLTLVALMYGFSRLPEIVGGILTFIGIIGIWGFINWESRTPSPILNVNVFRSNKAFVFSNLAALLGYMTTTGVIFLVSLYLQYVKGFSPQMAGLIMLAQPVVQAILSPFMGRLSDKTGPYILASTGMACLFIGLLALSFLSKESSVIYIIATLIVLGTGFGLFSSPNINAIMSSVVPKYYGVAASMIGTVRTVGQTFSMGITTIVISIIIGRVAITPEFYPSFLTSAKIVFGIFAALCFCGIFASLARGTKNQG
jgi:MFS family permease